MAHINVDDNYLTVLNIFDTDSYEGQDKILDEMRHIIDSADYEGWVSSTLLSGVEKRGTANYIQWRSVADLEKRYATDKFRHDTVPVFEDLSSKIQLLKTEVVFIRNRASAGHVDLDPSGGEYTVLIVMGVSPSDQDAVIELFSRQDTWLENVPGYISNTILRGINGEFVVNLAQWESEESYNHFHNIPEDERPQEVQDVRKQIRALITSRSANTYTVVHTRSNPVPAV